MYLLNKKSNRAAHGSVGLWETMWENFFRGRSNSAYDWQLKLKSKIQMKWLSCNATFTNQKKLGKSKFHQMKILLIAVARSLRCLLGG